MISKWKMVHKTALNWLWTIGTRLDDIDLTKITFLSDPRANIVKAQDVLARLSIFWVPR